jgi:carboxypeptidase PM20D1
VNNTLRIIAQAAVLSFGLCGAAANADDAVSRLAQAIQIPTISSQDSAQRDTVAFKSFLSFLRAQYPLSFERLSVQEIAEYSLLLRWQGSDTALQPVLIDAHYDVVPVEPGTEDDWTHPAFGGVVADGFVWGRGAIDDKISVISTLEALELLLAEGYEPQRTLLFSVVHDEEIGGHEGAANVAAYLKAENIKLEYMLGEGGMIMQDNPLLPDRDIAMISLAEKTYVTLSLKATGQGGHSSMPVVDNAIVKLARAVEKLHNNPFEPQLVSPVSDMLATLGAEVDGFKGFMLNNQWLSAPLLLSSLNDDRSFAPMIRSTTAVTMFDAGIKENVIAQTAEAKVNFRLLPNFTVDELLAAVTKIVDDPGVEIKAQRWGKKNPGVADINARSYQQIAAAIKSALPDAVVTPGMLTATTDTPHYIELAKNIYRFHPFRISIKEAGSIHGTNERVAVEAVHDAVKLSRALIQAAATP